MTQKPAANCDTIRAVSFGRRLKKECSMPEMTPEEKKAYISKVRAEAARKSCRKRWGDVPIGETVSIRCPRDAAKELNLQAKRENRPNSLVVADAIREYIEKRQ